MGKLDRKSDAQKETIAKVKAKKNARRKKIKATNRALKEKHGGNKKGWRK